MANGVYGNLYGYASTYIQVAVEYTETYSVANNASDMTVGIWYRRTNSYGSPTYAYGDWQVLINGTWYSIYTGTFTIPANDNSWYKVGEKTVRNIKHNNDGTKNISIGGWFENTGSGTSVMDFDLRDNNLALTTIPRASKASVSPNPLVLSAADNTLNVTTNRADSSFTHTVKVICGTWNSTNTGVGASTAFTIPKSIISQMTATEMDCSVETTTFNGSTQIGSTTTTPFKVAVDTTQEHAVIGSPVLTDTNSATAAVEASGTFIKGASNLQAVIPISVAGSYTTLASASVSIDGVTQTYTLSGTSGSITFSKTKVTGDTLTITVTDNRGYTVSQTVALTIIPYETVQINTAQIYRCNSNGTASETGTYIHYEVEVKCYKGTFGNTDNALTLSKADKLSTASDYGAESNVDTHTASGTGEVGTYTFSGVLGGSYSASGQYDIKFIVRDLFSGSEYVSTLLRGVPTFSASDNRFCVYGELDIHDKNDVTKYTKIYPTGYRWQLIGTASGSNQVAFNSSLYSEVMLVAKYEESSNNVWVATATVPTDVLTNASFYLMMPARIYSSSQYDRGCLIQINNAAASINEFFNNRASVLSSASLSVYCR